MIPMFQMIKKACLRFLLWAGLLFAIMPPILWFGSKHPQHLLSISAIVSQYPLLFTALRWLLIIAIFILWPRLVLWMRNRRHWIPHSTIFWMQQRIRITVWLAIFEITLCENLLLTLIHLWGGRQ